jgi:molecular chaperone GrpE (heat shock protein)
LRDVAEEKHVGGDGEESRPPEENLAVERLRQALAELEDAKRRVRRDAEKQVTELRVQALEALIPVLDNLERSLGAAETTHNLGALLGGMRLVRDQFLGTLTQFGLERVSAIGEKFDPRLHDAVALVPVDDPAHDGVVISELEPAYKMGDRIVRPAKVQVGRAAQRPPS